MPMLNAPAADIEALLNKFPKERPQLSPEMATVHLSILKANRERTTALSKLSNLLESWMHRRIVSAAKSATMDKQARILEIGGGTLNHLKFESNIYHYDVIEPLNDHYDDKPQKSEVNNFYNDMSEIPDDVTYDRIISIATLEHISELPTVVAKSGLLLSENGIFQAGIPNEGGMLWGLSWRISVGLAFRIRTGLDYSEHMRYEHINDASEIYSIIKYFFEDCSISRFPTPFFHLGLYSNVTAKNPNRDRCLEYLARRPAPASL